MQGVDLSFTVRMYLFVCLFVCLFVRLRISVPGIKLAASIFARWFIGVLGRESHFRGTSSPISPKSNESASARMLLGCCDSHAYQVRAVCGRRIGICG